MAKSTRKALLILGQWKRHRRGLQTHEDGHVTRRVFARERERRGAKRKRVRYRLLVECPEGGCFPRIDGRSSRITHGKVSLPGRDGQTGSLHADLDRPELAVVGRVGRCIADAGSSCADRFRAARTRCAGCSCSRTAARRCSGPARRDRCADPAASTSSFFSRPFDQRLVPTSRLTTMRKTTDHALPPR